MGDGHPVDRAPCLPAFRHKGNKTGKDAVQKSPGIGALTITLPIPGFVSVVGFAVCRLPGDGVQIAPGLPSGLVDFPLLFFRELLVGNEFFHNATSSLFLHSL